MPTTLTLFRGEKKQWWPPPEIRLMSGMTLYQPWLPNNASSLWNKLVQEVKGKPGLSLDKKVADYAQFLRATGRPFALATAWTQAGSFTSDYGYVIKIPNAHLYYWGGTKDAPAIGNPIINPNQVNKDFIVLNAATVAGSTILGFGHNTATKEITFFHDLPIQFIASCNSIPVSTLKIKTKNELSFDEKVKYAKFLR